MEPFATLVMDVKLVDIVQKPAAEEAPKAPEAPAAPAAPAAPK